MEFYNTFLQEKIFTGESVINDWKPTAACGLHSLDVGRMILVGQEFWVITERVKKEMEIEFHSDVEYLPLVKQSKISSKISRVKQLAHRKIFNPIIESINSEQQYILNVLNIKEHNQDLSINNKEIEDPQEYADENEQPNRDNPIFKRKGENKILLPFTYVSERVKAYFEINNFSGVECIDIED